MFTSRFYLHTSVLLGLLLLFLLNHTSDLYAQSAGKISGTVTDKTTDTPLPGVTVYLKELPSKGTTTDASGNYVLLSVPPGTYEMVFSFVGYATLIQEQVEVFSGRTTTINTIMVEEIIEGQELVVQAVRPLVVKDRTSTVSFTSKETIEKLPVQELGDLVRFQPGVVESNGGFNFRGGRTRETAYLIDGIPVQDVFSQTGGNGVDLEVQSVQELQVFTGTFDAELGGAQSGVVSVTTRDPGKKLEGRLRLQAGGWLAGDDDIFIGGDQFKATDNQDIAVTLNGPLTDKLGFFVNVRYENNVGHLKGVRRYNTTDGLKVNAYRRWFRDVYAPDDTRLIALDQALTPDGTPILDSNGEPITFASGDNALVNMSWNRSLTLNPKLVYSAGRSKFSLNVLYNDDKGQGFNNSKRYAPEGRATNYNESLTAILSFKRSFGSDKVLNLRASYADKEFHSYAYELGDPRIQFFSATDDVSGFSFGGTENGESKSDEQQLIISGDFQWQVNNYNEVKAGFQFRQSRFRRFDLDRSWAMQDDPNELFLNFRFPDVNDYSYFDEYLAEYERRQPVLVPELASIRVNDALDQSPMELAWFIQDKLEFNQKLVVKAGLRFEYFDVNERTIIDPRTPTDRIGLADNFRDVDPKLYVSPRIGVSYPISERGAFRVAYGHFIQMTAYNEMLKNPIFSDINIGRLEGRDVGNPDLDAERTIKYEIGLQQELTNFLAMDVTLFYKNTRNLLGRERLSTLDNVQYTRSENRDFGIIRGGTFALATRPMGMLLSAAFDVTFSDATGSSSNPNDLANLVIAGRSGELSELYLERRLNPLNWDQTLTANVSATVGKAADWSVGFVSQFASGQPFSPNFLDPNKNFPENEFLNTEKKPMRFRFDLNAEKRFKLGGLQYGLRLQVNNLFNVLNQNSVNSISGNASDIVRLASVQQDRDTVNQFVGLYTQGEEDIFPQWYSAPRQVLMALTLNF